MKTTRQITFCYSVYNSYQKSFELNRHLEIDIFRPLMLMILSFYRFSYLDSRLSSLILPRSSRSIIHQICAD